MFHTDILELNLHGGPDMNLEAEDAFEGAAFFVEINEVGGFVAVDPVLMMVASNPDAVIMPNIWLKLLNLHFPDDPGLP